MHNGCQGLTKPRSNGSVSALPVWLGPITTPDRDFLNLFQVIVGSYPCRTAHRAPSHPHSCSRQTGMPSELSENSGTRISPAFMRASSVLVLLVPMFPYIGGNKHEGCTQPGVNSSSRPLKLDFLAPERAVRLRPTEPAKRSRAAMAGCRRLSGSDSRPRRGVQHSQPHQLPTRRRERRAQRQQ